MSALELINRPVSEITDYLLQHNVELIETNYPHTYMIKFTEKTDLIDPLIKRLKGMIFNHEKKEIISMTYPVPVEMKDLQESRRNEILFDLKDENYDVIEALDGTLFRYSYLSECQKWILSTNGKINASQAYWMNGISLGTQFESAIGTKIDFDKLNKDHVYLFQMCHPLNIIVVNHGEAKIYHVATYNRITMCEVDEDIGFDKPKQFEYRVDEVMDKIQESKNKPVESAGFMVCVKKDNITYRYRFENINYSRARVLRGNSTNIEFTLLKFLQENHFDLLCEFLEYYPVYQQNYSNICQRIEDLAKKIHQDYINRYARKLNKIVHHRHHKFIDEIHQKIYLKYRSHARTSVSIMDVKWFFSQQPAERMLYLLNYIYQH